MQDALANVTAGNKEGRRMRRPVHRFRVDHKPWEITPFLMAPVLPGETMKKCLLQSRVVSDPLVSPLIGWWCEHYLFYVKHRQMPNAAAFTTMMLDPTSVPAATAASARDYYTGLGYNWAAQCLEVVTREWFREEGELWTTGSIRTGYPAAKTNMEGIHESLFDTTLVPDGGTQSGTAEAQERTQEIYQYLRAMKFTQMTYEDWLRTWGVGSAGDSREKPELIRYSRDWTYPANTVEPTTGVPTSAASWAVSERADKDRFFTEPGFIFGVTVVRPKIYLSNQTSFAGTALDNAFSWLPPLMADDPSTSIREFTTTQGPFGKASAGFTNGYLLDVRDLFLYGDQWLNAATQTNSVALPTIAAVHKYATETMADTLFSGAGKYIKQDGAVTLDVLGTQMDYT